MVGSRPAGESGENGTAAIGDGNDLFVAFDNADAVTPSTANAFANFGGAWGESSPDKKGERSKSDDSFGKFDSNADKDRSPPRRSASNKAEQSKQKKTRPRRKSGNSGGEGSGTAENLSDPFSEMNVSNPERESEARKARRERGDGEKRSGSTKSSGGERRRRSKEKKDDDGNTPRRNRSGRESRTTS